MEPKKEKTIKSQTCANKINEVFKSHGIIQVSYVTDAGHSRLIQLCRDDQDLRTLVLTTEEEGSTRHRSLAWSAEKCLANAEQWCRQLHQHVFDSS